MKAFDVIFLPFFVEWSMVESKHKWHKYIFHLETFYWHAVSLFNGPNSWNTCRTNFCV